MKSKSAVDKKIKGKKKPLQLNEIKSLFKGEIAYRQQVKKPTNSLNILNWPIIEQLLTLIRNFWSFLSFLIIKLFDCLYQAFRTGKKWQKLVKQREKQKKKKVIKKSQYRSGSFHARHPRIILLLKIIFFPIINPICRYFLLLFFLIAIAGLLYVLKDLPSPRRLTSTENYSVSTQIFDRNGTLLYEIFGDENRIPVKIETLPPHILQATIAIEDKNFYRHFGFDLEGIIRAAKTNLEGGRLEGGSTITQQLVKNALLTPERSFKRKVKEAILAVFTELLYSKEEILEMYLNYISYGGTAVGIQSASQYYFDKNASDLTLAESAVLAGLPQAPSLYSPFGSNPQQAKNRQAEVLRRMAEDSYISYLEAENARALILKYALSQTDIQAPHFVFYVRDLLYQKYGVEKVEKGGLRVTTTLDLEMQRTAQASLSAEINSIENKYRVSNGASIIVKPNTGEILAMIGSRDYFDATHDGQVNVTLAERQPGSSIKPLMYSTNFQYKNLNPGTVLLDVPTCFNVPGQTPYCPKNYDGTFKGAISVRECLGNSLNIPAVRALKVLGVENFINQATKMGITTWKDPSNYGLSLTLGGGEVRMIDMAQAFSVLANLGVKVPLTPILEIKDYQGKLVEKVDIEQRLADLSYLNNYEDTEYKSDLQRVMDKAPAYLTCHIMQDNKARQRAFGSNNKLEIPGQIVSAKTGTTNDMKDNWTFGFTPEILVAVWVGNNDGTPMSRISSGITGAAPIFNDIMSYLLKDKEPVWQEKPNDVLSAMVCANGMPPEMSSNKCSARNTELFWTKSRPSASQYVEKEIWVKADTGLSPAPGESADNLVLQKKMIYQDPLTEGYCVDCVRQTNEEGQTVYEKQVVQ